MLVRLRRLFETGPQIVVDDRGIWWRRWSRDIIPWSAVSAVSAVGLRTLNHQSFVCLRLHDAADFPSKRRRRWFAVVNRSMGFGDVALTTLGTDRTTAQLYAAIAGWTQLVTPPLLKQ